jgi:hypothetical protein
MFHHAISDYIKRSILKLSNEIYKIPHQTNHVEDSSTLLGPMYKDISTKIQNAPIPTPIEPSKITPIHQSDYMHIPEIIRQEIETKYGIVSNRNILEMQIIPKYFYRINLPKNRREINIGIWGNCSKKDASRISYKMIQWLYYLDETIPLRSICSNTLTIYFFMTDHVKKMPINTTFSKLKPIHVNSAFTYGCTKNNRIFLFRKEEWFKVFIHESMHALGVDFSSMSTNQIQESTNALIHNCFHGVQSNNLCIYESYTELWAELINILISTFESTHSTTYNSTVKKRIETMIHIEITWSLIQANKILQHYQISNYKNLFDKNKTVYKENADETEEWETCVFSYYILKSIMYFYWIPFLKWCSNSNSKPSIMFDSTRILSFVKFLCKHAKGKYYQTALEKISTMFKNKDLDILHNPTLIMSIWGKYYW